MGPFLSAKKLKLAVVQAKFSVEVSVTVMYVIASFENTLINDLSNFLRFLRKYYRVCPMTWIFFVLKTGLNNVKNS